MTANNLIQRLNAEADSYEDGSHMHSLCSDAADQLTALESMMDGSDISRKALAYDVANHERLINDSAEALNRATATIAKLQQEVTDAEAMTAYVEGVNEELGLEIIGLESQKIMLNSSNEELVALLSKKTGLAT